MSRLFTFAAMFSLMALLGCGLDPTSTEEGLLRAAFTAIKNDNWADYARLTITECDFILKEQQINRFKAQQSFAGGVLKPEEEARQKELYRRAVQGGPGQIDFKQSRFVEAGQPIDRGYLETLSGGEIPFKKYAIRVDSRRMASGSKAVAPWFVVVPWQESYRLLRLEFGGAPSGE